MVVRGALSSEMDYQELYVYSGNYKLWFIGDIHNLSAAKSENFSLSTFII